MAPERITVFTTMPPGVYSGGRYLSLMLATAMARAGAEVAYVTNNAPLFESDFLPFEAVAPVRRIVTPAFDLPGDLRSDWVVVIPTGNFDGTFYQAALDHARAARARVALLSFETPNWYDALSPFPRSAMPTESWRQVVAGGGLVVTIAREGLAPAAAWFGSGTPEAPIRYGHWHPTINDLAADAAARPPAAEPRVRVTAFVRVEDPHKGALDLLRLPPDLFGGLVLSLVFGRGVPGPYVEALRRHYGSTRDFVLEVHSQIADVAKFELLARSRLLLFPSYFEGYGYPPVEAAWMGVPTVAYDLPLLREVAGEAVTAVPIGDVEAFAQAVREGLARGPDPGLRDRMPVRPDTLTGGRAMLDLLRRMGRTLPPAGPPPRAAPLPPNPRRDLPSVRALLSRQGEAAQIVGVRATLSGGVVAVRGRVAGGEAGDLLRLEMRGLRMPEARLGAAEGRLRPFAVEGDLDAWPGGARGRLDVTLLRTGGATEGLGHLWVDPDWRALLERPSPGAVGGTPEEAVLVADPARLAARPAESAALAELAEALRRAGRATRLLWRGEPDAGPADPDAVPLDLMPLVDRAEAVAHAAWEARLAQARDGARGLVASLGPEAPDPGRPAWRVRVGTGDEAPVVVLQHPDVTAEAEMEVAPDPSLARRSLARGAAGGLVLLVPDGAIAEVPEPALRLLARAERALGSLRALIPERLWGAPGAAPVGLWSWVEPLGDAALLDVIDARRRVAALRLGPSPDAAAASLARALTGEAPLGPVGSGDPEDAEVERALLARLRGPAAPAGPDGRLSEVLARLAPPLPTLRPPEDGPGTPPGPAPVAAPLALGGVQSFVAGAPGPADRMLAHGWTERGAHGARLDGSLGLVVFELTPGAARPPVLEVMLRHQARPDVAPTVDVLLNGRVLGSVRPAAPGASAHAVPVPAGAWHGRGPQVVGLRSAEPSLGDSATELQLVALSLRGAPPPRPDWASRAPGDGPRAHVVQAAATGGDGAARAAFGVGERSGPVTLQAGWAAPEPGQVWSDGTLAALVLSPPLPGEAPVLIEVEASGYAPPGSAGAAARQRARVSTGGERLAEWVLTSATGRSAVVIPPGRATDHLAIELPDAVRPADIGAGQDVRRLGLRLASLALAPLAPAGPAAQARALPGDEAVADLAAGRVRALRVEGPGAVAPGTVLATPGAATLVPLRPRGMGWEAFVPLDGEAAGGRATLVALAPGAVAPSLSGVRVEPWGDPGPPGAARPLRVMLLAATVAAGDVRDWGDGVLADLLSGRERPRLEAPLRIELGARAPEGVLLPGWSRPDEGGTWSAGAAASLALPVRAEGTIAVLRGAAYLPAGRQAQRVVVSAGDRRLATLDLRRRGFVSLPLALPAGGWPIARLDLAFPDALSPHEAGESADVRRLGFWAAGLDLLPLAALAVTLQVEGPAGIEADPLGATAEGAAVRLRGRGAAPWAVNPEGDPVLTHPLAQVEGWAATLVVPAPEAGAGSLRILVHHAPPGGGSPAEALTLAWRRPDGGPA